MGRRITRIRGNEISDSMQILPLGTFIQVITKTGHSLPGKLLQLNPKGFTLQTGKAIWFMPGQHEHFFLFDEVEEVEVDFVTKS